MISVLLIAILAQATAPQIHVDADGFVTVIEDPEAHAREQRHIEMLADAEQSYRIYRDSGEGDLGKLIDMHVRILESGMELVPEVHRRITMALAELHRRYATAEEQEVMNRMQKRIRTGEDITRNEAVELHEALQRQGRRKHMLLSLELKEETVARLPEDERLEAARILSEMAMMAQQPGDRQTQRQSARYYLRARAQARMAMQDDNPHISEAQGIADVALKSAVATLQHLGDSSLCQEFIETYSDDKELVKRLKALLSEQEDAN